MGARRSSRHATPAGASRFVDALASVVARTHNARAWKVAGTAIASAVVFITTYTLILPAITLDVETAADEPGIEVSAGSGASTSTYGFEGGDIGGSDASFDGAPAAPVGTGDDSGNAAFDGGPSGTDSGDGRDVSAVDGGGWDGSTLPQDDPNAWGNTDAAADGGLDAGSSASPGGMSQGEAPGAAGATGDGTGGAGPSQVGDDVPAAASGGDGATSGTEAAQGDPAASMQDPDGALQGSDESVQDADNTLQDPDGNATKGDERTLEAQIDGLRVCLVYGADANLPENAELLVRRIVPEDADFDALLDRTAEALAEDPAWVVDPVGLADVPMDDDVVRAAETGDTADAAIEGAGVFSAAPEDAPAAILPEPQDVIMLDISIMCDGSPIEPAAPVRVTITPVVADVFAPVDGPVVVHLADAGDEVLEPAVMRDEYGAVDELQFQTDSCSVFSLVLRAPAKSRYTIAYTVSPEQGGTISFTTSDGVTTEGTEVSVETYNNADAAKQSVYTVKATPAEGFAFTGWTVTSDSGATVTDWGQNSKGTAYSESTTSIKPTVTGDLTLSASFQATSGAASLAAGSDASLVNQYLAAWRASLTQDTLTAQKTAEVYDYENRIYQVDLTASSGLRAVAQSIDLVFITDTSRSMYFPETIAQAGTFTQGTANHKYNDTSLANWLATQSTDNVYYIVSADDTATMYAVYYGGKSKNSADSDYYNGWRYVDASYFQAPDGQTRAGFAVNDLDANGAKSKADDKNPKKLTGIVYSAPAKDGGPWTRLDYLKLAVSAASEVVYGVDPSAEIGLVTFNKEASPGTFYKIDANPSFQAALSAITLSGGTNQQDGLDKGKTLFEKKSRQGAKPVAVLITDGAPNADGVTWTTIDSAATALKNYNGGVDLYTLGLSLSFVGETNRTNFNALATSPDYAFSAESGQEIAAAIRAIVESILGEATLTGTATDVIDQAFYPVDANGNPLAAGTIISLAGEVLSGVPASGSYGTITFDGTNYGVAWSNVDIGWPTGTDGAQTPGWHGTVLVKAREDFLGGNTVSTNTGQAQVVATGYTMEGWTEPKTLPEAKTSSLPTTYVNVDELGLTQNETMWTVYVGTDVDPLDELKRLWHEVDVCEVVTAAGTDGRNAGTPVYTPTSGSTVNPSGGQKSTDGAKVSLASVIGDLTDAQWQTLIDDGVLDIPYGTAGSPVYGHTGVGTVRITLNQVLAGGEQGLDPSLHKATVPGEGVEQYTLTVTYLPNATSDGIDTDAADFSWHTGSFTSGSRGADADTATSTNEHVVNVFQKGLQITKTDMSGTTITASEAQFVLYRKAATEEEAARGITITGLDGTYVPAYTLDTTGGVASQTPLAPMDPSQGYVLVETRAPAGYNLLPSPLQATLDLTQTFTAVPSGQASESRPATDPYSWTQAALLTIVNINGSTSSYVVSPTQERDSRTAVVEFSIKDNPGRELPYTGGMGTGPFVWAGTALLAVAGATALWARRRREGRHAT